MSTGNQISIIRKFFYGVIMLAIFGGWGVPSSAQAQTTAAETLAGVTVSLSADQSSFDAEQSIILHVTMTNPNAAPVKILKWLAPINGLEAPLFTVTRDEKPVAYLGKIAKRAAPTEADYIVLAAGAGLTRDVDLAAYYDLSASGAYQIQYQIASPHLYLNAASGQPQSTDQLASSVLGLTISGRVNPEPNKILPQSVSGTNTFNSCSGAQQTALINARNAASVYAANAVSYFSAAKQGARYTTWFGVYNATRYNSAASHFTNIQNAVDTASPMAFDCTCTDDYYAYVYKGSPYNIYLCNAFWSAPTTGTDSKAGTLIHEISHFTIVADTDDWAYGQAAAQALAISNPTNAVDNADSHEYFAENNPVLENDTTAPVVSSSVRANTDPTSSASVNFTVTFSEYVTGVDTTDFSLTTSGVSGASVSGVSGTGTTRTVTVNTGSGNGTIRLDVTDNDTIVDWNSNPLGGAGAANGNFITGQVYTVTKPAGDGADTVGVFRPSNGALYMKNANTTGFADYVLTYGLPGDYPVVGDWDGNGTVTLGVYRDGNFYLRNSNTNGFADMVIAFGAAGDQPVAGDWDGDGTDTIGVYRSSIGTFFLRNTNTSGAPDISFSLGVSGDVGIVGDWDGNGTDTTGVFRPTNGALYLKNANTTGFADIVLTYGLPGDKPVTGDWNNDGIDTIGIYRAGGFYLRNSNTNGYADINLALGIDGDMPIAGDWDGIP